EKAEGIIFNIGNDHETSINELASLVIEMTDSRSTVRHISYEERYGKGFEDTRRRVPDVRRAATVLGFRATVELRDGLARTLQWWRQTHQ
ncbi:MAG: NAD-dependent dehydratase, partial [Actinomycetota bacterium]